MPGLRLLLYASILAGAIALPASSVAHAASRVLAMDPSGRVHARIDRALAPPMGGPAEGRTPASATRRRSRRPLAAAAAAERTVRGELKRLLRGDAIDATAYRADRAAFDAAVRTVRRLRGTRRTELLGVIGNLHDIAARGDLTPSRLPALFATLERNRRWWTTGSLLSSGQRVEFSDSELVWQYYPGEGIELQVLGTFGKANGLWMARDADGLRALLDEMIPLAADRDGALAWEYEFDFGGGAPPWTSAMSQATGIQALARAAQLLHDPSYLEVAGRALKLLELPPPVGVRVRTSTGARYLLYSYAPRTIVANAFAQTLVGLYDYAQISADPTATALFSAGDRQARRDMPAADTGAWSLYELGGPESTLSYHELLRDFLRNLCDRLAVAAYCDTADRFTEYLHDPPDVRLVTARVRAKQRAAVRFQLSKVSRVGMTIRGEDGRTLLSTSATVSRGGHWYGWTAPRKPGTYDVTLVATDLAGNVGRGAGTIAVLKAAKPRPKPRRRHP